MGSKSDYPVMEECIRMLERLGITHTVHILSAHRTPDRTRTFAANLEAAGVRVVVAGAGGSAHLPGFIASLTPIPVIGVPLASSDLRGVDALYSIVQMPAGVPVACMAIGKAGARNAALMAGRILGLTDPGIRAALDEYRRQRVESSPQVDSPSR
jgi:5-(carboxyamino)imidazole ribonucleotide mutase